MPKKREEKSREWPRVLVAAPTSIRHNYCVDDWVKSIRAWDYPKEKIEIMAVDNTPFEYDKNEEFYAHLKNLGITVFRVPWDRNLNTMQMLALCREMYRQYAWYNRFDYLFNLDTDTTIHPKGLKTLLSRKKDQIGPVVHVYPKSSKFQPPCVFKQTGFSPRQEHYLYYYTWPELRAIERMLKRNHKPRIYKVGASPLGCLLVSRKVFSHIPFTIHDTLLMGEDMWYHNNSSGKGFEFWIDFSVKVNHNNTDWDMAQTKHKAMQKIWLISGYEDAKKAVVQDNVKGTRKKYDIA